MISKIIKKMLVDRYVCNYFTIITIYLQIIKLYHIINTK